MVAQQADGTVNSTNRPTDTTTAGQSIGKRCYSVHTIELQLKLKLSK